MESQGLTLTTAEQRRIEVIQAFAVGKLNVKQAAEALGRSVRTIYRMQARLDENGLMGLVHGNRGRPSNRCIPDGVKRRILKLAAGKYQDVNDTHLQELLRKHEDIEIGRETLRRLLRSDGIKTKRRRRHPKYRSRRERKAALGQMLQLDASPHDWLEGRGPWLTAVGAIDDATNKAWVRFFPAETTWAYLELMEMVCAADGLPLSVYNDRHSIFVPPKTPTIVEQLNGEEASTQFGRAMRELGVRVIPAYSPQAKGRIERLWGTLQDRLVVEMRLARAKTLAEANAVLKSFLQDFNRRFTVPPRQRTNVFRKPPPKPERRRILCLKAYRTVARDHTVAFEGLVLQIPPHRSFHSIAGRRVDVLQLKDGSIEIDYRGLKIAEFSGEAVTRMVKAKAHINTHLKVA